MTISHIGYPMQLYSGTATSSSDTHSSSINTKYVNEGTFFLDITAVSGTSPTLVVEIETYNTIADKWQTIGTFSSRSAIADDIGQIEFGLGEQVAISYTIGGTTPSFTFSVNASLK